MGWLQQASTTAQGSDRVFFAILGISVLMLLLITGLLVFFVLRYSRKRHPRAAQIHGHVGLEIAWTLVPLGVFLGIFYFGWTNFNAMRQAPKDAMVVQVTGRQWNWSFRYPNGKQTAALYSALDRPLKLELRSADVIHGFFIPAFRLKMDALPGRTTTAWFQPTRLGAYDIECTVICGVSHAEMLAKVVVCPEEEFKAWYFGDENAPEPGAGLKPPSALPPPQAARASEGAVPEPRGLVLARERACLSCHSVDGRTMVGPSFKGMLGRREQVMAPGGPREITVDEARLRRVLRDPEHEPVRGYPPVMPPARLGAEEAEALVQYLKTLR